MYKILRKENLAEGIYSFDIAANDVAKKAQPGQFIILIVDENGERIPLTICDTNLDEGSVNIVVQGLGVSTKKLFAMEEGDYLADFLGPLGLPSKFVEADLEDLKKKKFLLVAGGLGTAPLMPQAKWLRENGIAFDVILGARNKDLVILEDRFRDLADELLICTDDGSYGLHGLVTDGIDYMIEKGKTYDQCISIGPMIMMKFVCLKTKGLNIPTIVSMNPIMVDGTGMCGACRLSVGGQTKFACVDGPEFDGHQVDFDQAMTRMTQYKAQEDQKHHEYCDLGGGMNLE
ncbi:MAG: sulfide/dihydroorotate dehydrogenase-like FAD/NAD-binding protein [Bacillota bacterium]|nr:sulfide/dihydroorotate dehydrogenase-like FAD/NAD-binding protein [Bacillota bacterium]